MSGRKLISDIMQSKKLTCLSPDTTVASAAKKMFERQVSAVMVTYGDKLLGIVTDHDINFRVVAAGANPDKTLLSEIMTVNPDTLVPGASVLEALDMMQAHGYRHVPVEANGRIIGVVAARDLFDAARSELEEDISDRDEFIFGSGYSVSSYVTH